MKDPKETPPTERFARVNYWLEAVSKRPRDGGFFMTNLPMDVELLFLFGVQSKNIIFVADDPDTALKDLEHLEEMPGGPPKVVVGDPFEVADQYKRKLNGFFYAADVTPSIELCDKLGKVARNGKDGMSFGFRILPGPLPPVLEEKARNVVRMTRDVNDKLGRVEKAGHPNETVSFLAAMAYSLNGNTKNPDRVTAIRTFIESEEEDGVLRHTAGAFILRRGIGESTRSFFNRYVEMSRYMSFSVKKGWEFFEEHLKGMINIELAERSDKLEAVGITLDDIIKHMSDLYSLTEEYVWELAGEVKARRVGR